MFKNKIKQLNINILHFKFSCPKTLREILIKDSRVAVKSSTHIKKRLLKENILKTNV